METPTLEALIKAAWDEPSLEALIEPLIPNGKILEIGFGSGYSARRLQSYQPKHHTIIEPDEEAAAKAIAWAEKHKHVFVMEEAWEDVLGKLGTFDAIFFYQSEPAHSQGTEHEVVKQGKSLLAKVHHELPQLTKTRYTNEDIDYFFTQVGQHQKKEMGGFIYELRESGQISPEQYEKVVAKHHLENKTSAPIKMPKKQKDNLIPFLEACLSKHTHKGSRIFCFSLNSVSNYESPEFLQNIITNPHLEYQEKLIPGPNGGQILVSIIEKLI